MAEPVCSGLRGPVGMRLNLHDGANVVLLKWLANDSCEAVVPCFSSLSRCLSVMTAIRLAGPGSVQGRFFGSRAAPRRVTVRRKWPTIMAA